MVVHLERAGKLTGLLRAAGNAAAFRDVSGLSWREMLRQGRAMRRDTELTWGQVLIEAIMTEAQHGLDQLAAVRTA